MMMSKERKKNRKRAGQEMALFELEAGQSSLPGNPKKVSKKKEKKD